MAFPRTSHFPCSLASLAFSGEIIFHGHGSTAPGQVGVFSACSRGRGASCVEMSVKAHEPQDQHCGDRERKSAPLSFISCHAMSCFLVWLLRHDEKRRLFLCVPFPCLARCAKPPHSGPCSCLSRLRCECLTYV